MKQNDQHSAERTSTETTLRESAEKSLQEDQENKHEKPQVAEKCECPPGCVGLHCCT
jgi:hypothetical protein